MTTFSTTTKWALRWLTGGNPGSDVDAGFQALAEDLDGKLTPYDEGLIDDRPTSTSGTPGKKGRYYRATDDLTGGPQGTLYYDYGTGWVIIPSIGTGAQQAAPGNDARLFQAGDVKYSARTAVQAGWLLFAGQTGLAKATYPDLWQVASTEHAASNPLFPAASATTFALADLRGRAPIGAGTGAGLSARALGALLGEESHTLTRGEVPSLPVATGNDTSSGTGSYVLLSAQRSGENWTIGAGGDGRPNPVNSTGGGAHNNMQPSVALNVLVKT